MAEFLLPSLGADMEDAILIAWLAQPGDMVERGQVIAEIETQKGIIEIEAFEPGVLADIRVTPGQRVPVGTVLAMIEAPGEDGVVAPAGIPPATAVAVPPTTAVTPAIPAVPAGPPPLAPHIRVSPVARKLAEELGVDLHEVTGTGPHGAIQRSDVEEAAARAVTPAPTLPAAPSPTPPAVPIPPAERPVSGPARTAAAEAPSLQPAPPTPSSGEQPSPAALAEARRLAMRDAIAKAMARSKREIPHYYLGQEIDFTRAQEWLAAENLKRSVADRIVYATLLLKAAALACREVPEVNGFWEDGAFRPSEAVHVGVAISLRQGGLVAPAIHHTDLKSLDELMATLRDLVMRARTGKLRGSEMSDPTITVTNLGEQGVSVVHGIIYPPQVALVGFGAVVERPWAINGMLGVRPIITATLAADHRASDGHRGGIYLQALNRLLQDPEKLR